MSERMEPYIYDVETYKDLFCCTLLSLDSDKSFLYIIDDKRNDSKKIIEALSGKYLIGYNNKTFDNLIVNYIFQNGEDTTHTDLHELANGIIGSGKKGSTVDFYQAYKHLLNNDAYKSIDLMRMLFSKKLRVSLKELECSMNFKNVRELPYPPDANLTNAMKREVVDYNMNDCLATKQVALESLNDIKLRFWTNKTFGVDVLSLDGVNLGVKILEQKLAEKIGNRDFVTKRTIRDKIVVKDILYPFLKFETPEFNKVLDKYKKLTLNRFYNEEKEKYEWSKFKYEPQIGGYVFKYGLGGLHFGTRTASWHSTDSNDILSIDVASYYPSEVEKYPKYCKPAHLPDEFIGVYVGVKKERLEAKLSGDKIKDGTYKLSINGAFGNMSNEFSWLYDVSALLAITINGQLMLSMLCEKLIMAEIELIDVNTDGVYVNLKHSQREIFDRICKWWSSLTKMVLEETKFESMYFLTTGDYFGTTYEKDKESGKPVLKTKEKGCFITKLRLGKGMEFPIIYQSVKEHYLNNKDFYQVIHEEQDIINFCSFKKLNRDYTCFWKGEEQQRVNRFYASREGAHLYKRKWDGKRNRFQTDHVLKDSAVKLLNNLDDEPLANRNINYGFYTSKARDIIRLLDAKQGQISMF